MRGGSVVFFPGGFGGVNGSWSSVVAVAETPVCCILQLDLDSRTGERGIIFLCSCWQELFESLFSSRCKASRLCAAVVLVPRERILTSCSLSPQNKENDLPLERARRE